MGLPLIKLIELSDNPLIIDHSVAVFDEVQSLGLVSAAHVQVGTSVLPLTGGDSVAGVVYVLFVDVGARWNWDAWFWVCLDDFLIAAVQVSLLVLYEPFRFVEVVLSSHTALGLWASLGLQSVPTALVRSSSRCRSPTIRPLSSSLALVAEVVEVVEHEVHVFLLLALQVVDYALVFVDLDPDVGICLPRNGSGFYEAASFLVHVVAALSRRNIEASVSVEPLLPATHGLVVEFSTLFLKLVVADIKSVSS